MLPPLLKIIINEPRLLTEHLDAYSQLVIKDVSVWQASIKQQAKWKALQGINLFLFLLFAGIAVMLWGTTQTAHWSLIVIPLIPLSIVIVATLMRPRESTRPPFAALKKQFSSDMEMLKGRNTHG